MISDRMENGWEGVGRDFFVCCFVLLQGGFYSCIICALAAVGRSNSRKAGGNVYRKLKEKGGSLWLKMSMPRDDVMWRLSWLR